MIDVSKESENMLRLSHFTMERSADAVFWVNAQSRIHHVNEAACKYLGYSKDELLAMRIPDIDPDSWEKDWDHHWNELKKLGHYTIEVYHVTKSGRKIPVEVTVNYIKMGEEEYSCSFVRDITNRKRAEKALQDALNEVEALKKRLQAENTYLQEEIKLQSNFEKIIGQSKALKKTLKKIEQVAPTDSTVLILGETGTGKELFARAIHNLSRRKERPLIKVNCAALPGNLIESELFGHEKGAFTGAIARRLGRFELADSGTIFLDEIGELPLDLQSKLLRVLQESEFERLGNANTIRVDARVIAASNRDLETEISAGNFREDLYYRLNIFPIKSPPLRERKEDIPILVNHFTRKLCSKIGKKINNIPQNVIDIFQAYDWPGNVRELENVIERTIITSSDGIFSIDEFVDQETERASPKTNRAHNGTMKEMEREHILSTLQACNWIINGKRGAAVKLGLHPSTLRDRMRMLGIKRPT